MKGIEPRTHTGVVSEFARTYVKTGEVEHLHLTALSRALNERLLAEYDEEPGFSAQQAQSLRSSARDFVDTVRGLLESK